jgi:hypothetical protein
MKPRVPRALTGFLKPYDRAVRSLALALREVVLEELAPCHENIYDAYNAVAVGYGTSDRLGDGIVHIAVYPGHVNLGFNDGVALPDPRELLLGKGSQVRHLTIRAADDLARPEIRAFLRAARKEAGKPASPKTGPRPVISTVKRIYARKRRPR